MNKIFLSPVFLNAVKNQERNKINKRQNVQRIQLHSEKCQNDLNKENRRDECVTAVRVAAVELSQIYCRVCRDLSTISMF